MKILFLGTGAADWSAQKSEVKEHRRFSAVLIDGVLLIDFGGQIEAALAENGVALSDVKYLLNTHSHRDHYSKENLALLTAAGAELVKLSAGESVAFGRYTVYAYSGNHGTCKDCLHYIVTDGTKTLFYGLDGAWLLYDEVQGIKAHKPNLAILDATVGRDDGDYRIFEHNSLSMVAQIKTALKDYVGRFCISHMARTLHPDHKTLSDYMAKQDIITAYDGLELEI